MENRWQNVATREPTHVFSCYVAHVSHIHDAAVVPNHAHSDGVFAHLRSHVLVHLDAQIFQHQQTWRHTHIYVATTGISGC